MNNNKIFASLAVLFLFSAAVFAQTGKPQYLIRTERADTTLGYITIELFPMIAPLHSAYFDSLVNIHFYDTTAFHRVVPDFVIQGGDPNSRHGPRDTWGMGDSTQQNIPAEFSAVSHLRGIIGAARDEDINSANSQFFINVADNTGLNGLYTAYGKVVEGMDVVDFIVNVPADENDNPIEKIEMFVTALDTNWESVDTPVNISPPDGEEGVIGSQSLQWSASPSAVIYSVQVAKDSSFLNIFYSGDAGGTASNVNDLELGQVKYYWRVKAGNGGAESGFSEPTSFVTSIETPVLSSPDNGATDVSLPVDLEWNSVNGAVSYRILIAKVPTFSSSQIVLDTSGVADTALSVSNLEYDKKYYWKVQGETETYQGPKSPVWSFTTAAAVGVENEESIPKSFALYQNFPNPFNPSTSIRFDLPKTSHVSLTVYDILGNKISEIINEEMPAGRHSARFKNENLSSGVYLYKLHAGQFSSVKKFILMK